MIKAALFDLDGTLANTMEDLADAVNYALEKHGYPPRSLDQFNHMIGDGAAVMLTRALPPEKRSPENAALLLPDFLSYYGGHFMDKTYVYNGIPELLSELKGRGLRLAVVTNKVHKMALMLVARLFPDTFDLVLGQQEGIPVKPDPALMRLATEKLGAEGGQCVFIGDSGVDMRTALNGGALPIGVTWGFRGKDELRENGAKHIVTAPGEILDLI